MNVVTAGGSIGGAYPLRVAAALAHMPTRTVRRWVEGYDYTHKGERRRSAPVTYLAGTSTGSDREETLDFEQLLTLLLVRAFQEKGLSLQTIKRAAARAHEFYQVDNPFVSKRFRSDGNRVFIDFEAPGKERALVDVLSDQHSFHRIVDPFLFKDIVFVDGRPDEWWPLSASRAVVLTPRRQFGAPAIARTGIRTDVIAQAVAAEGGDRHGIATVAAWFDLRPDQVNDAVFFEGPWLTTKQAA